MDLFRSIVVSVEGILLRHSNNTIAIVLYFQKNKGTPFTAICLVFKFVSDHVYFQATRVSHKGKDL